MQPAMHRNCICRCAVRSPNGVAPSRRPWVAPARNGRPWSDGCVSHGCQPLSRPKFAAERKRLGCSKWKSWALNRYKWP